MSNRLTWSGLAELRDELRRLPAELAGEASAIVIGAAEGAKADMHYPRRTGNLADHLYVTKAPAGIYGAGAVVKNTAKHAWLFENGTQARHTAIGANRGSMPPGHVFLPAVIRRRRAMYDQLKALLVRHGLVVSGEA
jgi:hypothetical protein